MVLGITIRPLAISAGSLNFSPENKFFFFFSFFFLSFSFSFFFFFFFFFFFLFFFFFFFFCFILFFFFFFFFQAEDGIRDDLVTGVQTCALPISLSWGWEPPDICCPA